MSDYSIKLSNASLVVIGHFSPPQFHPDWFESEKLIRKGDAKDAKINIIAPDVSHFTIPGISFQVLLNRLTITANDERFSKPVKDLATSIFFILPQTPVRCFGVNHEYHFKMKSPQALESMMASLVPSKIVQSDLKPLSLMELSLQSYKNDFSSEEGSFTGITLGISNNAMPGVHISINNHFEIKQKSPVDKTSYLTESIEKCWTEIEERSKNISKKIMESSL